MFQLAGGAPGRLPGKLPLSRRKPVALLGVHDGMQVMQREIFGPLLPILGYRDHDQVVQYINDRPHPLALYLFSHQRALQLALLAS